MTKSGPIQWYYSHADLIWPDGPFKTIPLRYIQSTDTLKLVVIYVEIYVMHRPQNCAYCKYPG
jgi:hypothetical protein